MKIALLTDGIFPFSIGGMQKHSYYLTKHLARKGVWVDLYFCTSGQTSFNWPDEYFTKEELHFIRFFEIDFPHYPKLPGHYILESYRYSEKIFSVLKNNIEVDFIYIKGFSGWKFLQIQKSVSNCPPIGINFPGLEIFQYTKGLSSFYERLLFKAPIKYCLRKSNYVFSLGGKLTEILRTILKTSQNIIEIPNGVDDFWLRETGFPGNKIRRFVFIGRHSRFKGIEILNKVLMHLDLTYDFEFHFIGPIPGNAQIKYSKILYHGSQNDEIFIKGILENSDYLVCPSLTEGMPNVILEAMACGCGIIATDVGAVSKLVSSETGWLIPPADHIALEKCMVEALTITDISLIEMKQRAISLIGAEFTWERVIDKTIKKIQSEIKTHNRNIELTVGR